MNVLVDKVAKNDSKRTYRLPYRKGGKDYNILMAVMNLLMDVRLLHVKVSWGKNVKGKTNKTPNRAQIRGPGKRPI